MNVFLTGATGYIGSALARGLRARGHEVTALVRPDSDSKTLRDLGATIVAGDLSSLSHLSGLLGQYTTCIHTAAAQGKEGVALDRTAVDSFTAPPRRDAHFIYTSGVWVLGGAGAPTDESSPVKPLALVAWRAPHERLVLNAHDGHFVTSVIRPGCVYGGKQSLLADWFAAAEQNLPARIIGDGKNRWALVDLHDLVDCYIAVAERRVHGLLHAVDDSREPLDVCARAVFEARGRRPQIELVPLETARQSLGPFADALAVDQEVGSARTREDVGWNPRRTFLASVGEQWREWDAAKN
jgi:nucleoside-diphosphate-sugar epimerase